MTTRTQIISSPSLDIAHHRIHEGNHFSVHKINKNLMIATPKYFLIIPPDHNISHTHLVFEFKSYPGGLELEILEDADILDNGSELTPINQNRHSAPTVVALTKVYEDPTPAAVPGGTKLYEEYSGTNTTTSGVVGEIHRDDYEFVLMEKILFKITVLADNTIMSTHLNWYDNRPSKVA